MKDGIQKMAKVIKMKEELTPTITTIDVDVVVKNLYGGRPTSPDVLERWLKISVAKGRMTDKDAVGIIGEAKAATRPEMSDEEAAHVLGFKSTPAGIFYVEARQVKAMLREALALFGEYNSMSSHSRHYYHTGIMVTPDVIETGRTEPDSIDRNTVHVDTMRGPRSSIKNSMVLENVKLGFLIHVVQGVKFALPLSSIERAMAHAATNVGLGADRSQLRGQFEIVKWEQHPAVEMSAIPCKRVIDK